VRLGRSISPECGEVVAKLLHSLLTGPRSTIDVLDHALPPDGVLLAFLAAWWASVEDLHGSDEINPVTYEPGHSGNERRVATLAVIDAPNAGAVPDLP
jgi:hypothetical protein